MSILTNEIGRDYFAALAMTESEVMARSGATKQSLSVSLISLVFTINAMPHETRVIPLGQRDDDSDHHMEWEGMESRK